MHSIVAKLWNALQHMIDGVIGRLPELVVALIIFFAFYILSGFVSRGIQRAVIERRQNLAVLFGRLASGATVALGLVVALSIVAPSFQVADLIKILGIGGVAIGFAFQENRLNRNFASLSWLFLSFRQPFLSHLPAPSDGSCGAPDAASPIRRVLVSTRLQGQL